MNVDPMRKAPPEIHTMPSAGASPGAVPACVALVIAVPIHQPRASDPARLPGTRGAAFEVEV